jgi:parallel beta-helix repeat protein
MRTRAAVLALLALILFAGCHGDTDTATSVTYNSATLNGTREWVADDGPGEFWYEVLPTSSSDWGAATEYGRGSYPDMVNNTGTLDYAVSATGLLPGTAYKFRFCGYGDKRSPSTTVCADADGDTFDPSDDSGGWDTFTTTACDDTQGATETLATFLSSNPAGTAGDREILCVRGGSQSIANASPRAYQTLVGASSNTLNGDFSLSADGVTLENLNIVGCRYATGCASSLDKAVEVTGDGVTLRHLNIGQAGGKDGDVIQCVLVGTQTDRVSGFTLEWSRVHDCGSEQNSDAGPDHYHGLYCSNSTGATVKGNWLYYNEGWGIHLYPDCDNITLVGNVVAENGLACVAGSVGSTTVDNAAFSKGVCGFSRQNAPSSNEDPIHCQAGVTVTATDMVLYDAEAPATTDCGASLTQTNTSTTNPNLIDRTPPTFDLRPQETGAKARMGVYADNVPGPTW